MVIALHGYTDNANTFMNYTGFKLVADKNGFAVCYPQGLVDSSGNTFWQVGYSFHRNEKVNDVEFLTILTKHLQSEHGFNRDETFATGMSNGGDDWIGKGGNMDVNASEVIWDFFKLKHTVRGKG